LLQAGQRPWLKGVWLYETIDSGEDPTNREHRFGLLRRDGMERPAGCMVREFGASVAARPTQVVEQGAVTLAVYQEAGRSLVFAWVREGARGARVRVRTSAGTLPPAAGAEGPCQVRRGTIVAQGSQLELRAELDGNRPVVFAIPQAINLEGVQLD
jgi:hypothetical protein